VSHRKVQPSAEFSQIIEEKFGVPGATRNGVKRNAP
jgi:hypothetical protein